MTEVEKIQKLEDENGCLQNEIDELKKDLEESRDEIAALEEKR